MNKYNKGDKLICRPGYASNGSSEPQGGSGWEEGRILIVDKISSYSNEKSVYWSKESGLGVYEYALKPFDEIINNYELY